MENGGTDARASALIDRFTQGMAAQGFDAPFLAALTERRAPLFRLLAAADLQALFRGAPTHGQLRARLPAAFAGADPATAAEILAVLHAARTVLSKPGANQKTPREPFPRDEIEKPLPDARLRLPTAEEFGARLSLLNEDPAHVRREQRRKALFETGEPETAAQIEARIGFLRREYGVRLPNAAAAGEQIAALGIDALAHTGSTEAVLRLERLFWQKERKKHYAFATAYCHCLQPKRYPVFNRRVQTALCALREQAGFYPFLNENLKDYEMYLKVLSIFCEACGLAGARCADAARYLEDLGRRLEAQTE